MKRRRHSPFMLGEYWVYALAGIIAIVTLMPLYSPKDPIGDSAGGDGLLAVGK
jgi:hypothetical protein